MKWPNDVWIGTKKLAGILIESRPGAGDRGWAVIGVGLNISTAVEGFPAELRETATSLAIEGTPPSTAAARATLNEALARWIDAPAERVLTEYRERDALRHRSITWDGGSGIASGIDDSGHLLVATRSGGTVRLGAGEVHLTVER